MTKPNFEAMKNAELVAQYNEMVLTAIDLGLTKFQTVTRFAKAADGVRRCEALHTEIARAAAQETKEAAPETQGEPVTRRVDLYDATGEKIASEATASDAAFQMGLTEEKLVHSLVEHGLSEAKNPQGVILTAVWAGVPLVQTDNPPATAGETAPEGAQPGGETASPDEGDDEMAKRGKKATAGRKVQGRKAGGGTGRARENGGTTIREMTEEYNAIVAKLTKAQKEAAPFAKHHSSYFESKDKAKKQLDRLKKAVAKA